MSSVGAGRRQKAQSESSAETVGPHGLSAVRVHLQLPGGQRSNTSPPESSNTTSWSWPEVFILFPLLILRVLCLFYSIQFVVSALYIFISSLFNVSWNLMPRTKSSTSTCVKPTRPFLDLLSSSDIITTMFKQENLQVSSKCRFTCHCNFQETFGEWGRKTVRSLLGLLV